MSGRDHGQRRAPGGRSLSIVLAGGGSAGHISPALALAAQLCEDDPRVRITALGTPRGLETTLIPAAGIDLELIPSVPLPRRITPQLARVPGHVAGAIRATVAVLDRVGADVVVGFGSYVALPAYLAARRRHVPLVVHEANLTPGIGNRIGARLTSYVAVAAAGIDLPHARVVGMPLRAAVRDLDRAGSRERAIERFGLEPTRRTLLVTGGSQGARRLNQAALAAAPALAAADVQVLHIAGPANDVPAPRSAADSAARRLAPYLVLPYVDRMEFAYAAADFVLCRAGMNTVCELTAVGLPAAYVPLPIGNGEQRHNAAPVVAAGGGMLVDDVALSGEWIVDNVLPVLTDPAALQAMSLAAAGLGRRDAAHRLAELVYAAAGSTAVGAS